MPISIMKDGIDIKEAITTTTTNDLEKYPFDNIIRKEKNAETVSHSNKIDAKYIAYLNNIDSIYLSGISYGRYTNMNLLIKNKDEVVPFLYQLSPIPETKDGKVASLVTNNYDLLAGKLPEASNELMLIVDSYNKISADLYNLLGLTDSSTFTDVLNKEIKLINNNEYYTEFNNIYIGNTDYVSMYENSNNITLKIVGIIRGKKDNQFSEMAGTGLSYKDSLLEEYINKNKESAIVKKQEEVDYNVLSGQKFDESITKEMILSTLGGNDIPFSIQLYPKDFNSKDKIIEYLDKYNETKQDEDKIVYTDYASTVTELSSGIMNGITLVLVGFSSVSLIVSSIMISIITYISVLERTKEIGILRSLGARKRDISRVFNAETCIIGFVSGVMGVGIAYLLTFPINIVIKNATDLSNVALLSVSHAIIMITISVVITMIGGLIPAKMASKKDPVVALRTE